MIFHKDPIAYDAWIDQPDIDETILAFAVSEKIPLLMAIVHPLHQDDNCKNTALIAKQFIQDRFLQLDTWLPHKNFSWTKELSEKMTEIKGWLIPKAPSSFSAISQMIWLNWIIVVHPRTAFLLSIGEIHTHLLRRREWQSWSEIPVDYAESDTFSTPDKADDLPSINVRQCPLYHGDMLLMAHQSDSIQFSLCLNRKDVCTSTKFAKETVDRMNRQMDELQLTKPAQSTGLIQVL